MAGDYLDQHEQPEQATPHGGGDQVGPVGQPSVSTPGGDSGSGLPKFFLFIFPVVGLVLVILAVVFLINGNRFNAWPHTQATVVNVTQSTNCSSSNVGCAGMFDPTVSYTVDGKDYTDTPTWSTNTVYNTGDVVTVAYNPSNPADVMLAASTTDFTVAAILGFIGLVFLAIGLFALKTMRESNDGDSASDA